MNNVPDQNTLLTRITELIELTRHQVVTAVNLAMVHTYFEISRTIVDDEQQGNARAAYGKATIADLAARLTTAYGKGFSARNLEQMRINDPEQRRRSLIDPSLGTSLLQRCGSAGAARPTQTASYPFIVSALCLR